MATIQEVRQAEKKVGEALEALKNSDVRCPDERALEPQRSTDEYVRAVRELKRRRPEAFCLRTAERGRARPGDAPVPHAAAFPSTLLNTCACTELRPILPFPLRRLRRSFGRVRVLGR